MKTISSAIQTILDADQNRPILAVVITLTDDTVLRIANHPVTISSNAYQGDLMDMPRLVVGGDDGIDHIRLRINNADWSYGTYHNNDLFDGADVQISQYFATTSGYDTFEGPVLSFTGTVTEPVAGPGTLELTVIADARMIAGGTIGRTITGRCMYEFGDDNCGYTYSATVQTGGSYPAGTAIPLSESFATGQVGLVLDNSTLAVDTVKIVRGTSTIYSGQSITDTDWIAETIKLSPTSLSLQSGDKIVYEYCPRNWFFSCLRRGLVGSSSRQQDNFGHPDYNHNSSVRPVAVKDSGYTYYPDLIVADFAENIGAIIPIPYGQRWVEPMVVGVHAARKKDQEDLAAWNSTLVGPFVIALIGEGPVTSGIEDVETDILLDRAPLDLTQHYAESVTDKVDVKTGTTSQTVSDFAPQYNAGTAIPNYPRLANIAYMVLDLPRNYEIDARIERIPGVSRAIPATNAEGKKIATRNPINERPLGYEYAVNRPDLIIRYKGRNVQTWYFSGGNPTQGSVTWSRNPVWQIFDLLMAGERVDASDLFGPNLSSSDLDLASAILWADYCDDTINIKTSGRDDTTDARFVSDIYITDGDRQKAINDILDACRGTLVFRNGKVGIVLDAPTGGSGTLSSATSTSLTDSDRDGATLPTWPAGGLNGALAGCKVEILDGAGAGQVRTITSNDEDTVNISSAWTTTPSNGDAYAVYAVSLSQDNCGNIEIRKKRPAHELYNRAIVNFESDEYQGIKATVPITNAADDDHRARFGLREQQIDLAATIDWSHAVREGWYRMRKQLDQNFEFLISDANVEALPLEVGDTILLNHDINGISNQLAKVERIEETAGLSYNITATIYAEQVYLDWPTEDLDDIKISSNLRPPHGVPPHVENVSADHFAEAETDPPLVVIQWDLPRWPYVGWYVDVLGRHQDPVTLAWSDWTSYGESRTSTFSCRVTKTGTYRFKPIFVSHVGVRADDPLSNGTSSGGNTSTTLNDTTKNWYEDGFVGVQVKIVSGTGYDSQDPDPQTRDITTNTGTQLTVDPAWTTTPDGTSGYHVFAEAPEVEEQITSGVAFGFPVLDEDDGDLYLQPGFMFGESCKWYDSDTAPTKNDVTTSGTLQTRSSLPDGGVQVHTFTTDGEVRYVGVVYYLTESGTGGESGLYLLRYTYNTADNVPQIYPFPYIPDDADKEAVRFIITDDGTQVNFGYAVIDEGTGDPTWTSGYTMSGLQNDPLVVDVEVTKPAEGGTRKVILFNAVDANSKLYRPATDPGRIYVDGNANPLGFFSYATDSTDQSAIVPIIYPHAIDSDCMSWRFRVNKTDIGSESFSEISFNDSEPTEFSGNTFAGGQYLTGYTLTASECLNIAGQFYRTSATDDSSQQASIPSEVMKFTVYPYPNTMAPTVKVIPSQSGTPPYGNLSLVVYDPGLLQTGSAFHPVASGGSVPSDPLSWDEVDTTGPPYDTTHTTGVALEEKHNTSLHWAVRWSPDGGVTQNWITGSFTFDFDTIPEFSAALTLDNGDVYLQHIGDEDLGSIGWVVSTSGPPSGMSGESYVNVRQANTQVYTGLAPSETLYVRVRGYTESSGGGGESTNDWTGRIGAGTSQTPTVQAIPSQSGSYGNITISVYDPGGLQTGSAFDPQPLGHSPGSPDSWDEVDYVAPYQNSHLTGVEINEKHVSAMFWGVRYSPDGGTTQKWITGGHTFDLDQIPNFSASLTLDGTQAKLAWVGDEDTACFEYVSSTSGPPANFDGSSYTNARVGNVSIGSALTAGQTLYVLARGWSAVDKGGTASTENWTAQISAPASGTGDAIPPLAMVASYKWIPSPAAGATHKLLIEYQVGALVRSVYVDVESTYNYTFDKTGPGSGSFYVDDEYGSDRYWNIDSDSDPVPIELTPYSAVSGGGTAGSSVIVDAFPPDVSGVGPAVVGTSSATLFGGSKLLLDNALDITSDSGTGYNPKLGLREGYNLGSISGSTTPDYANGPCQYCSTSGDATLNSPTGLPSGGAFHIHISVGSGDTLTLSGWGHPYPTNDFLGPCTIGLSKVSTGGGSVCGLIYT